MQKNRAVLSLMLIAVAISAMVKAAPNKASDDKRTGQIVDGRAVLENAVIRGEWKLNAGRLTSLTIENKHTGQMVTIGSGHLPGVVLSSGRTIDLASVLPAKSLHLDKYSIVASFDDKGSGLSMRWSVSLNDGDSAIIQTLQMTASRDTKIKELVFLDATLKDARQVGSVAGSVVVCGDIFMAVEHPLAQNTVGKKSHVRCALGRGNVLKDGQSCTHTSAIGVVPSFRGVHAHKRLQVAHRPRSLVFQAVAPFM